MAHGYAYKATGNEAKALGTGLTISFKSSVELCRSLRGKNITKARRILDQCIELKQAVPFRRYMQEIAHNKNVGPGRFPVNAAKGIKGVIDSAEANAQLKGLSTANLVIKHICAQRGGKVMHYGRNRGEAKNTHIEVVLCEGKPIVKKEAKSK